MLRGSGLQPWPLLLLAWSASSSGWSSSSSWVSSASWPAYPRWFWHGPGRAIVWARARSRRIRRGTDQVAPHIKEMSGTK